MLGLNFRFLKIWGRSWHNDSVKRTSQLKVEWELKWDKNLTLSTQHFTDLKPMRGATKRWLHFMREYDDFRIWTIPYYEYSLFLWNKQGIFAAKIKSWRNFWRKIADRRMCLSTCFHLCNTLISDQKLKNMAAILETTLSFNRSNPSFLLLPLLIHQ